MTTASAWLVPRGEDLAQVATGTERPRGAVCELDSRQVRAWFDRARPATHTVPVPLGLAVVRVWVAHGPRVVDVDGRRHALCRTGWAFEPSEPVAFFAYSGGLCMTVRQTGRDRFDVHVCAGRVAWSWPSLCMAQFPALASLRSVGKVHGLVFVESARRVEVVLDGAVVASAADRPSAQRAMRRVLVPDAADATAWTVRNGALVRVD